MAEQEENGQEVDKEKGPEVDEAEMIQQLREELQNLTVTDHLLFMMHSLSALAVDRMDLTGEAGGRRDLEEARLAIDAFKALTELVGRVRPAEEMAVHRGVLSQLQMNYVGALGGGGPQAASTDAATDTAADTAADTPSDELADKPVETPADEPADVAVDTAADELAAEAVDEPADTSADAPGAAD